MKTKLGRRTGLAVFETGTWDVRHAEKNTNARKTAVRPTGLEKRKYLHAACLGRLQPLDLMV
ncbi:MAG: hypothetical protein DME21_03000 [Verrucomicrobia bacterium]|nr:MAG: hypothetical protein DME21_03000 [Verrucomicrobiota bacterium]